MKPFEQRLSRLLRSQFGTIMMLSISVIVSWITALQIIDVPYLPDATDNGIITTAPTMLIWSSVRRTILAQLLLAMTLGVMLLLNKWFNLLRTTSIVFIGLTGVLLGSIPALLTASISGVTLAFTILMSLLIMLTIYDNRTRTRRIFLIFFALGCGGCIQQAFAPYTIVFILGCAQMRCLTFRSFLAACIGIITPFWLLCGSDIVSIDAVQFPQLEPISSQSLAQFPLSISVMAGVTLATTLIFTISNVIKIYGFNAQTRAFNGLLSIITLFSIIFCLIDWGNLLAYLPLLYCLTAMQATLFFRFNLERRGYLAALFIVILSTATFFWSLCIPL